MFGFKSNHSRVVRQIRPGRQMTSLEWANCRRNALPFAVLFALTIAVVVCGASAFLLRLISVVDQYWTSCVRVGDTVFNKKNSWKLLVWNPWHLIWNLSVCYKFKNWK